MSHLDYLLSAPDRSVPTMSVQNLMECIRNDLLIASDQDLPLTITKSFLKLITTASKELRRRVPQATLQSVVGGLCDLLSAPDDFGFGEEENAAGISGCAQRTGSRDTSPDPFGGLRRGVGYKNPEPLGALSIQTIPLPPNAPPPSRLPISKLLTEIKPLFPLSDHSDSDSISSTSSNYSRASTVPADPATALISKLVESSIKRPTMNSEVRKLRSFSPLLSYCTISPMITPPGSPKRLKVPTTRAADLNSWLSHSDLTDTARDVPPLIDQYLDDTGDSRVLTVNLDNNNDEAALPTQGADDSPDDDLIRYQVFYANDYTVQQNEVLHCNVCEVDLLAINHFHRHTKSHRDKRRQVRAADWSEIWEVTADGSMRCNLCDVESSIRTTHAITESHAQVKRFKSLEELEVKRRLWSPVPASVLNDLTVVHVGETGKCCVLCEQYFEDYKQWLDHKEISAKHRAYQQQLRTGNVFSCAFGVITRCAGDQSREMQYCVLCKVGITNSFEYDYHLYGSDSQHLQRLRTFWITLDFSLNSCQVLSKFSAPVKDMSRSWPDSPQDTRPNDRDPLRQVLILVSRDGLRMCCVCNRLIEDDDDEEVHCRSPDHVTKQRLFSATFTKVNKASGIIKKKKAVSYCVLCRVGFTNLQEAKLHVNTDIPHKNRIRIYLRNFCSPEAAFEIIASRRKGRA